MDSIVTRIMTLQDDRNLLFTAWKEINHPSYKLRYEQIQAELRHIEEWFIDANKLLPYKEYKCLDGFSSD